MTLLSVLRASSAKGIDAPTLLASSSAASRSLSSSTHTLSRNFRSSASVEGSASRPRSISGPPTDSELASTAATSLRTSTPRLSRGARPHILRAGFRTRLHCGQSWRPCRHPLHPYGRQPSRSLRAPVFTCEKVRSSAPTRHTKPLRAAFIPPVTPAIHQTHAGGIGEGANSFQILERDRAEKHHIQARPCPGQYSFGTRQYGARLFCVDDGNQHDVALPRHLRGRSGHRGDAGQFLRRVAAYIVDGFKWPERARQIATPPPIAPSPITPAVDIVVDSL